MSDIEYCEPNNYGEMYELPTTPYENALERRSGQVAVPHLFFRLMNCRQLTKLSELNFLRWELFFIRREHRVHPLIVLRHAKTFKFAVIDENGDVEFDPQINVRIE